MESASEPCRALYGFSGDPITYGHIDIVRRALRSFGTLLVAIGHNPQKRYSFSIEERTAMAQEALRALPGVRVVAFHGLLTDLASNNGIKIIVRGIRNISDLDYENTLYLVAKSQMPDVDYHFLPTDPKYGHISSGATKALQLEHGFVHEYVPLHVKAAMEQKISTQVLVGVAGEIAAGKSYVCRALLSRCKAAGIPCHHVDLDLVAAQILDTGNAPCDREARAQISAAFGKDTLRADGFVDRAILGKRAFADGSATERLNGIMREPVLLKMREALREKKGVILLEGAILAEVGQTHLCNNRIVLVRSDRESQKTRLIRRGLAGCDLDRRFAAQLDADGKALAISKAIDRWGFGSIWEFDNRESETSTGVDGLYERLVGDLDLGTLA